MRPKIFRERCPNGLKVSVRDWKLLLRRRGGRHFHQAGYVLWTNALFPSPPLPIVEQTAPLALLDVTEYRFPEELAPGPSLVLHDLVHPRGHVRGQREGDGPG